MRPPRIHVPDGATTLCGQDVRAVDARATEVCKLCEAGLRRMALGRARQRSCGGIPDDDATTLCGQTVRAVDARATEVCKLCEAGLRRMALGRKKRGPARHRLAWPGPDLRRRVSFAVVAGRRENMNEGQSAPLSLRGDTT